ncbi:CoA pyrophosphatase [Qipengyuania sp.]|uniref:CoA pyrophosphatase n=1 Tax=Qipengyuania sp. TaxID=2004515 RepID=UPI0035C81078
MSALFDRLSQLFEQGHARDVGELLSDRRFADAGRTADAAVLIAVTDRSDPGVILTQRPRTMRDHPGQVAFPGGKLEAGEDAVTAALREAREELAMDPAEVRVVGTTDRYQTGTGFDITPVLAVVPPDLPLQAHPREVESWFEAPLSLLMDERNWQTNSAVWKGAERHYYEMDHAGYRIWGVTAAICANLSRRLAWVGQD